MSAYAAHEENQTKNLEYFITAIAVIMIYGNGGETWKRKENLPDITAKSTQENKKRRVTFAECCMWKHF